MKSFLFTCIISISAVFPASCEPAAQKSERVDIGSSEVVYKAPEVPKTIRLWGKDVDVSRRDMQEKLDRELTINAFMHGSTILNIKRVNRYFPQLAPILKKNGIPEDMVYLAIIESNLDERAVSPAKAAGLWQFMPATARQYGLEVNEFVDERYNVEKATQAACKYFKEAYAKYGDWNAVAASYNAGMKRISSEMASQQQDNVFDLYLVTETTRYPFRLMAVKTILENPEEYGFYVRHDQLYEPIDYDVIEVDKPIENLVDWAIRHGVTYNELREHNQWIRAKSLPNKTGKTYRIRLPKN